LEPIVSQVEDAALAGAPGADNTDCEAIATRLTQNGVGDVVRKNVMTKTVVLDRDDRASGVQRSGTKSSISLSKLSAKFSVKVLRRPATVVSRRPTELTVFVRNPG
jgi:hypothetical protein